MRARLALVVAAVALALPTTAAAADFASPGGDLELRASGATVELLRADAVVESAPAGAEWNIRGADGVADTLIIRNPEDGIVPARVKFAGGDGDGVDALRIVGGRSDRGRSAATGPDSGSIVHQRGDDNLAVEYSGLEPVTDTVPAANFTQTYSSAADAITIDDGVALGDGRIRIDTPTTEEIEVAAKTNITIDGGAGSDNVTIDNSEAPAGLTGTMTVVTGAEANETIGLNDAVYTGATLMLQTSGPVFDANGGAQNVVAAAFGADAGLGDFANTAVDRVEADTDTGAIGINNSLSALQVGGVSGSLHGLRVGGDSSGGNGSIVLGSGGSVTLNDATGPEAVRAGFVAGSVSLVAAGAFSTTAAQDAVRAPAGSFGV